MLFEGGKFEIEGVVKGAEGKVVFPLVFEGEGAEGSRKVRVVGVVELGGEDEVLELGTVLEIETFV